MRAKHALLAALFALPIVACNTAGEKAPPAAPAVYQVQGEILRLPDATSADLLIRHEAIPDFRDEAGKVVGMDAMTMPFAIAEGVSLAGLAPGDTVKFTLETAWERPRNAVQVVQIEKVSVIYKLDLESGALPPAAGSSTPQ